MGLAPLPSPHRMLGRKKANLLGSAETDGRTDGRRMAWPVKVRCPEVSCSLALQTVTTVGGRLRGALGAFYRAGETGRWALSPAHRTAREYLSNWTGSCPFQLTTPRGFLLRRQSPSVSSGPPMTASSLPASRALHRQFLGLEDLPPPWPHPAHLQQPSASSCRDSQPYRSDSCGPLFSFVIAHSLDSTLAPGLCLLTVRSSLAGLWPTGEPTSVASLWCPQRVGRCWGCCGHR